MSESNRIDTILGNATSRLADVSDSARLDAELLLCRCIDMPRSYLFAHPEDTLDDSPATLVPRPETELLVDLALRQIPRDTPWQVLDLGTGSGAIAVAIAKERPLCQITAVDKSAAALDVARENVRQLNLGNVTCIEGDWVQPVAGQQFDIVVSNPPYVRADDAVLRALSAEPVAALVAGEDGLDAIRVLARDCGSILCADGMLLIEHGADQQSEVESILQQQGWTDVVCHRDIAGKPRVSVANSS